MAVRTFGIEEEFLLVDPDSGHVVERAAAVLREVPAGQDLVDHELLEHLLETRTEPCTEMADARTQLVDARRLLGEAAREVGVAAVATGTAPFAVDDVQVSPKDRYRDMVNEFGAIGRTAGTCGMHVHVGISSREEGIGIIDRLRPWLPVVLALSTNSPFAAGPRQRVCLLARPGVEPLADGRRHRALRRPRDVRRAGRSPDGDRRGDGPRDDLLRGAPGRGLADRGDQGRRRLHRPRRRRRHRRHGARDRHHRRAGVGVRSSPAALAQRAAARGRLARGSLRPGRHPRAPRRGSPRTRS